MAIYTALLFFKDPMVGTKPTFSSETDSFTFTRQHGNAFALKCPAQGYPAPKQQ